MNNIESENKYLEKYVRWSDKTRDQLSFFNNLLLTISIGFLSFVFTQEKYSGSLKFPIQVNSILMSTSVILILLSVIIGLLLVVNRLYDFRITSHINIVRYWFEKYQENKTKIRLDEKTPDDYCSCKRLSLTFKVLFEKYPRIKIEDCKEYQSIFSEREKREFNDKFRALRNLAHNLGIGTWTKIKWQIGLFLIGIICFVVRHLLFK